MNDILNQKTRIFFDEVDLFKQTSNNNVQFPDVKKTNSFSNNIYYGETVRGMTHVSPILQKPLINANSREISATYYIDANKINKEQNNLISDVDTDDEFIEFITKTVFHDKNNNEKDDKNEYSFELKIFISKDGNKITESYQASKVANDEILLFIEHGDDLFSTKKMYAKIGKSVHDYIEKNNLYTSLKNYLSNTDKTSAKTSIEISPLTIDQL